MIYKPFCLKDISTYRSELMGWAILWIMMLHFTFNQIKPLGFIAQYGFSGVDIFLFVSGLGLYYSLEKKHYLIHYYIKRGLRIFPTYYIIGFIDRVCLCHENIFTYLFRFTTIGFWTCGVYYDWFIPSLLVLYILSPYIKTIIDKRLFLIIFIIVAGTLGLSYYFIDKEHIIDRAHFFFLYRIPAFIFGMICAYWIRNNKPHKYFFYVMLIGIPFFVFLYPCHHQIYNYKYFSLLFLLPSFTMAFILISKHLRAVNPLFSMMGKASLEIYLIQGIFFSAIINGMITVPVIWHDTLVILFIIISTLLGFAVHWLIEKSGIQRLS